MKIAEREKSLRTEQFFLTPKPAVVIGGELYFGFDITRQFIKRAMAEEDDQHLPTKDPRDTWTRNIEIVRRYSETDNTHEEIGESYGLTRSRVQKIFGETIQCLWQNCSAQTQRLFPLNEIPRSKPLSQSSRERMSWSHRGRSVTIAEMLREGKTPEEIRRQILQARRLWLRELISALREGFVEEEIGGV